MLDIKIIRENPDLVIEKLKLRNENPDYIFKIQELDKKRLELILKTESLKEIKNKVSKEIFIRKYYHCFFISIGNLHAMAFRVFFIEIISYFTYSLFSYYQ